MKGRVAIGVAICVLGGAAFLLVRPWGAQGRLRDDPQVLYSDALLMPKAVQAITPRVTGSWATESVPGTYRYTYWLVNDPSSTNAIWHFALAPVPQPLSFVAPTHWDGVYGYEDRDDALTFSVVDGGTTPPADWDSVNIYQSPFDLAPGDSVPFSFVSDRAPAMVLYYAQGFHILPLDNESGAMEAPPTLFQSSVIGTVVGPGSTSGVPQQQSPNGRAQLRAPTPNPTPSSATIAFSLPKSAKVTLGVYDVSGRLVQGILDKQFPAGIHSATWNGTTTASKRVGTGVYFFRLTVDGVQVGGRKMVMVK